ncbi:MAG TPA: M56 family metallopeptidase, partial [Magnetospirillaceae bacterium]|nr:M56 family metallopeptidase [Magnetospirillaceae bacterium]
AKLSPEEYQAVLLHERAHLQRRDGAAHILANLLSACYMPPFRRLLLDALALASEEACDRRAASVVGARTTAAAILAVERLHHGPSPAAYPGFADGFVAERVRRLMAMDSPEPRFGLLQVVIPLSIVSVFLLGDVLYYLGMLVLYPTTG